MKKVLSRAENPSAQAMAGASSARAHHYRAAKICAFDRENTRDQNCCMNYIRM